MQHSASDRKSVREAEKRARIADRLRGEVLTSVMSTMAGRQWMWDVLTSCSIFSSTFALGSPDLGAFNEGRRAVGLQILADIMIYCPDSYLQAQRENNERHLSDNRSPTREQPGSPDPDGGDSGSQLDDGSDSYPYDNSDDPGYRPDIIDRHF